MWKKAVDRFQTKLQGEALALYQKLVEAEVVKAMAVEEAQSSQDLNQLTNGVEAKVDQLNQEIEQEPQAIPGGSRRKRRRLKSCSTGFAVTTRPAPRSMNNTSRSLRGATASPRPTTMPPSCA